MTRCEIPFDLDLGTVPRSTGTVAILTDLNLPLLAAHAGITSPDFQRFTAHLHDDSILGAQYLSRGVNGTGQLALSLPAHIVGQRIEGTLRLVASDHQPLERASQPVKVLLSQGEQSVQIRAFGRMFAEYRYNTADPDLPRPYFHPIYGPTGIPITQDGEVPGTREKHFHHTGLVLAHQNFTDGNNWQIGPQFSRMRHLAFDVMESGPVLGRFVQRLEWPNVAGDRVVFRETRTVTFLAREIERRYLDVDSTITCGDQPATWNATPYHLLALRVPDAMTVEQGGVITNSEGKKNAETAGAPAHWLDFSGPLGGKVCGAALFNHPDNPRSPTPWLNFENETVGAAPTYHEAYAWKPGEALRFRYRLYLHLGDVNEGNVEQEYARYVAPIAIRIGAPRPVA